MSYARPAQRTRTEIDAADKAESTISWTAFPRRVQVASLSDRQRWRRADASRDVQDEYCEWSVTRNAAGKIIRVVFPELTEERRREFIKVAKGKAEDSRISIRNIRRHAKETLDKLAKDGDAGEDDVRRAEKSLDDTTHKHVAQIDELLKHKETELLEV